MPKVYLVRHGKPVSGWGDAQSDPDPGLDADGLAQALAVAHQLLDLPEAERPGRVVSSPLRRCRETAQPLADLLGVEVEIEPAVSEIPTPAGIAASERSDWLRRAFSGCWEDVEGDRDYATWAADVARAVCRHPGAAIFSHFVAINAAVSQAVGDARVRQFEPGHVSVTSFDVKDGTLKVLQTGVTATTRIL